MMMLVHESHPAVPLPELESAEFSYAEVGATAGVLPPGYHHHRRARRIGHSREGFDGASAALLSWRMHRRAGVRVVSSRSEVQVGAVAKLRLGWRRLSVSAPVRVVYVVDEPRRRGFAYGTLPGHPESGEEAFIVQLLDDNSVVFTITAFSRHATALSRLGSPLATVVQRWVTSRYLRSV